MKELAVGKLHRGEMFSVAGHEYVVLDQIGLGVLVIESKSTANMSFGRTNDWRQSSIRGYLNNEYIAALEANGLPADALLPLTIDLKETVGGREYGYDTCKVGLLTLEQYIHYAEYIPFEPDVCWWLATPWGTPQGRSPYTYSSTNAWRVYTSGSASSTSNCSFSYGVRPALVLYSGLLVSQTVRQRQGVQ